MNSNPLTLCKHCGKQRRDHHGPDRNCPTGDKVMGVYWRWLDTVFEPLRKKRENLPTREDEPPDPKHSEGSLI